MDRKRSLMKIYFTAALDSYTNILAETGQGSRMRKLKVIELEGKKHLTVPLV